MARYAVPSTAHKRVAFGCRRVCVTAQVANSDARTSAHAARLFRAERVFTFRAIAQRLE